jgi:hypothetical protein
MFPKLMVKKQVEKPSKTNTSWMQTGLGVTFSSRSAWMIIVDKLMTLARLQQLRCKSLTRMQQQKCLRRRWDDTSWKMPQESWWLTTLMDCPWWLLQLLVKLKSQKHAEAYLAKLKRGTRNLDSIRDKVYFVLKSALEYAWMGDGACWVLEVAACLNPDWIEKKLLVDNDDNKAIRLLCSLYLFHCLDASGESYSNLSGNVWKYSTTAVEPFQIMIKHSRCSGMSMVKMPRILTWPAQKNLGYCVL